MGYTIRVETPTARKAHRCHYCGESINKGDAYTRWVGVDEGGMGSLPVHNECWKAWQSMYRDKLLDYDEGVDFAEFSRGTTCPYGCACELHPAPKEVSHHA